MSITFCTEPDVLAEAVAEALDADGRAEVTDLPSGLATVPLLRSFWLFDFEDSLELLIPAQVGPRRPGGPLAVACGGAIQPGGFRLVRSFERTDDGLSAAIALLMELAADIAGPTPSELTDLEQIPADGPATRLPSAAELAAELSLSVKGQHEAITVVAEATAAHLRKTEPRRPLRMLLVGPSGVGKGESYEALAAALSRVEGNGRDWQTVRLDGNQLREPHAVADLLGAPAGYMGHGDGTSLVQALATSPRTLVLIDEVDKAHPDITTALMGMMDHGSLQLRRAVGGRWSLDCRQAILVFTSNAGSAELSDRIARGDVSGHRLESLARHVLMAQGMPEWIAGRHGHIAVFRPLPAPALAEIATLEVARLAAEFGLDLSWVEPEVIGLLLRESDAGTTGARSIRSIAQRLIEPALAEHRSLVDAADPPGGPVDARVVVAGPEPRCVAYASWLVAGFPDLQEAPATDE